MEKDTLEKIKTAMFEAMSEKSGKNDLYWIDCLFDNALAERLGVKLGKLETEKREISTATDLLLERRVHDYSRLLPKAQLFSEKIPEGYLLFAMGPEEYKASPLKIICVAPIINFRDHHEYAVLSEIDKHSQEMMQGKNKSVEGKLIVPRKEDWGTYARASEKSFGPLVEPSADFNADIRDLVFFARIYNQFQEYQAGQDHRARQKATEIFKAAESAD